MITYEKKSGYDHIVVRNKSGMILTLCSLGAAIRKIQVPDRAGNIKCVTLSPVNEEYFKTAYHGKTIGRTSGRIAGAAFTIGEKTAVLERNNFGRDNLHGGSDGFHVKNFSYEIKNGDSYTDVVFRLTSRDGEGGYFGNVKVAVTYRIYEEENVFRIIYDAHSDEKTLLNLTNHVYLNMSGDLERDVREQVLYINAPAYGKLNERLIVEEAAPVNEEMDFTTPHKIGDHVDNQSVQRYTKGYDHPYFIPPHDFEEEVCSLYCGCSGIGLSIRTTYPCVVFYSDGQADESVEVFPGIYDKKYLAVCLECQYHPDGIHQTPDNCGIVSPERPYHEETEYKFTYK